MRNIRILFMGTPDFAVASLQSIIDQGYEVAGVITAPDRPAGRGRKLRASAVKEYATSRQLPILQPTNLKDPAFIEELEALQATLNIVVAFRMLPKVVWSMPEYGTFNLHASLLPAYRGAAPINWAIINGEQTTGVTTFFIDEKIDTGHIILQKEMDIQADDTAGNLHDKLMNVGASLVIESIYLIAQNKVLITKQPEEKDLKTAYKLNKDNTKINWNLSLESIYNIIRGLSPYPASWSYLYNNSEKITVKIYAATKEERKHEYEIGKVMIENSEIKVAVKNGFICVQLIQLPGKKMMDSKALLNGYTFFKDAKLV